MKIIILFISLLFISCNQNKKENKKTILKPTVVLKKAENFDWLLGKWKRLNEKEGVETFENWEKIRDSKYSGIGFTLKNGDTIKQEKMLLIKMVEKWNLTVKTPEDEEAVTFTEVHHGKTEFTFENNEIDFPNKIKYWKKDNKMHASVSNNEMKILFEFEKLNN